MFSMLNLAASSSLTSIGMTPAMIHKSQDGECGMVDTVLTFTTQSCHVENLLMGPITGSTASGFFGGSNFANCDNSSSSQCYGTASTRVEMLE